MQPFFFKIAHEATVVADIVSSLWTSVAWEEDVPETQRIFVLTPHRVQRSAVARRLAARQLAQVEVDTVERMQGREAEVTVLCYGFLDRDRVAREADFLLSRSRLNVSMTRARKCCILVRAARVSRGFREDVAG